MPYNFSLLSSLTALTFIQLTLHNQKSTRSKTVVASRPVAANWLVLIPFLCLGW